MEHIDTISSFVEGPLQASLTTSSQVYIKALTISTPQVISKLAPAFERYNEEQFTTVKLPGSSQHQASAVQSHVLDSSRSDIVNSILKSLGTYVDDHYPSASYGAYPIDDDSKVAIIIVANKYSPNNFWNGRWRSLYIYDPSSGSLEGSIKIDVHYYEDGNVRLLTNRSVTATVSGGTGNGIVREISTAEKKYQEEVNRAFTGLSEGAFKSLRRQLPVTRQKIEWEKVTTYRLGQDIGGEARGDRPTS
ncbi:unnamed protein product [Parascedosporium putredinis]|uniref:F-actin-capping protein subunit alpha n=1 Tax=Parascedosporium putredinis TaxID=1442378 RepID=A0A9P1HAM2_9PEZI|nr:unnamed protein product [Parascedosporium putredinis]CAI8004724.1 unnamed protein product [Parascedosporium putredinis]